jgi:small-conductance mechanosensitive channel
MYEGTLSASFDMEEEYNRAIIKLQEEIELLEEKKKKLQVDIRDDITQLLERRRSLL